jgi:hypothetical protein
MSAREDATTLSALSTVTDSPALTVTTRSPPPTVAGDGRRPLAGRFPPPYLSRTGSVAANAS